VEGLHAPAQCCLLSCELRPDGLPLRLECRQRRGVAVRLGGQCLDFEPRDLLVKADALLEACQVLRRLPCGKIADGGHWAVSFVYFALSVSSAPAGLSCVVRVLYFYSLVLSSII
jgi:hypothetical protein